MRRLKTRMTRQEKRAVITHECELEPEENAFALAQMVTVGWCISARRFFWNAIMIWQENPRAVATYKSTYVMRMENVRKLKMKNYVIHPFSLARTIWEFFMCIIFLIMFLFPFNFIARFPIAGHMTCYIIGAFNYLDIILTFLSGFQLANTQVIVCDYATIAKRYIYTTFFVDVIATTCYSLHLHTIYPESTLLQYSPFIILLRLPRCVHYAHNLYVSHTNGQTNQLSAISWVVSAFGLVFWLYEIQFVFMEQHFFTLEGLLLGLFNIFNMDYYVAYDISAMIVYIICVVGGFVLELSLFAFILYVIPKYTHLFYKHMEIRIQMESYVQNHNLSHLIKKCIFSYLQYLYEKNKINEQDMFEILPLSLQHELSVGLYSQLIDKSATFNGMPMDIILKLTARLVSVYYMPMEVIMSEGSDNSMYFIYRGMVAIFTSSGKEICHLCEGSSFGEMCLFEDEVRNVSVVAIDWCEMAVLTKEVVSSVFRGYPLLYRIVNISLVLSANNFAGKPYLNYFFLGLVDLPIFITNKYTCDRFGRRIVALISLFLAFLGCFSMVFIVQDPSKYAYTIIVHVCTKGCATLSFGSLMLLVVEIRPTCVRQSGTSLASIIENSFCIFGPYIIALGTSINITIPYMIFAALMFLAFFFVIFLPKTLGQRLPNTLEDAATFGVDQDVWGRTKSRKTGKLYEVRIPLNDTHF